ncbi:glycosyltransferase family 4 protein [Aurantimonas sp. A3-2-R12]|uniref:glycosyltransferase family 4 protein n=1 Tax=Aurantimonas sp. A3-2-R12 TaxID=3114362 RepID=UPI002E18AA8D|nr:glycosyltransferase family 4 protein [Aurantimonas sp. A3-2-R12]
MIGTYTPRLCGIATFTHDLAEALAEAPPRTEVLVVGMNDGQTYPYPARVALTIQQDDVAAYETAADALNALAIDVLSVQHEFGIFGGPAGSYLLTFLRRVRAPIVTTLHTVLEQFTPEQFAVIEELALLSAKLVVMSERAVHFLVAQGVPRQKIGLIHHGIPDVGTDRETAKASLGLSGRSVIFTFGLLSPNKGIETALRALPAVVRDIPDVTYLVLGATHPHIRAQNGEAYREQLTQLASDLGVEDHVRFEDGFAELDLITCALAAADLYLVPYLNREQIASGTLAYAFGNGKAVVSTPFWYAEELLAEGRGVLVPFRDSQALGTVLSDLLRDPGRRAAMEDRARAYGEQMRWPNVARTYADVFSAAIHLHTRPAPLSFRPLPTLTLNHVAALTDGTGVLQHATVAVPNPFEGYATDDNARALQLAVLICDDPQAPAIARRTLSFLHYALNPVTRRFRNFMSYDRRWLDEDGGDNAQARSVRALVTAAHGLKGALGSTAREILGRSWAALEHLESPRAQAIALIAIAARAEHELIQPEWAALADRYAGNLLRLHGESVTPTWPWFEAYLSYSNAKLPHGLIAYGRVFGQRDALATGLDALGWLEEQQTAPDGAFLPVGSERVYGAGEARPLWDGQPIEAYATVAAALEAQRATGNAVWLAAARRALEWLLGRNALKTPLYDPETAGCRDGLHRDRANANQGAESSLALWLSVAEYNRAARLTIRSRVSGL